MASLSRCSIDDLKHIAWAHDLLHGAPRSYRGEDRPEFSPRTGPPSPYELGLKEDGTPL